MKQLQYIRFILLCMLAIGCTMLLKAQETSISFIGKNEFSQSYVQLRSVYAKNLSRLWEEMLYYPDTTLVLSYQDGIGEAEATGIRLLQNVPNPFDGMTDISLILPYGTQLLMEIYDVNGRKLTEYSGYLGEGQHRFRATLASPQTYLLSATTHAGRLSIKMVNTGEGRENRITYLGNLELGGETMQLKGTTHTSPMPFVRGDRMKYIGYTWVGQTEFVSDEVIQQQWGDEEIELVFHIPLPTVITYPCTDITPNTANGGGNVLSENGMNVIARGVCWSPIPYPTIADAHTNDDYGIGSFISNLTGLMPNTTYYVRAYATSAAGTGYGDEMFFTTTSSSELPVVNTNSTTNITATTATARGNVSSDGGYTVLQKGVCYGTTHALSINGSHTVNGSGTGSFTADLTELTPGTTYYVRAYATNSVGTSYGNEMSFTTLIPSTIPTVATASVDNITATSATCGGSVTADGGETVTARGVCWSTSQNPTVSNSHTTNGLGTGSFSSSITGLTPNTTYYVRAYATNSVGTGYGNEVCFVSDIGLPPVDQPCPGTPTLTDVDSNVYNTVQIGQQCWMKENLRTTRYVDNTPIPVGSTTSSTEPYRYAPNGDESNVATYGYLYNWAAVMQGAISSDANPSGVQGICPSGWHVPSNAEWTQLTDYVSSQSEYLCGDNASNIAKSLASAMGWNSYSELCVVGNDPSTNNATGFSVLPAGCYGYSGDDFGVIANLWSATAYNNGNAWKYGLYYRGASVLRTYDVKYYGSSVRCLRDEGATSATLPTVTTSSVTNITSSSATCIGNVTSDGGSTVTARGVCYSTSPNPTVNNSHTFNGSGTGSFSSLITGLTQNTTYYVRAYATNSVGTAYGIEVSFTTNSTSTFTCGTSTLTDIDGNTYHTVQIGQQCWMRENLRTTKYADGTSISQGSIASTTLGYWYYPDHIASNKPTYGLLYNWKAVMRNASSTTSNPSGVQGICPTGWHVPSDAEWTQLTDYVSSQSAYAYTCGGNSSYIAKALAATTGWAFSDNVCTVGNDQSTNNVTGFSALPAGCYCGGYDDFAYLAYFWSATGYSISSVYYRYLCYNCTEVYSYYDSFSGGYSVRCLRD